MKSNLLNRSSRPSHTSDALRDSNNLTFFVFISLFIFSALSAMEEDQVGVATQALGVAIVKGDVEGVISAITQSADVNAVYTKKLFDSLHGGPVTITFPLIVHALYHLPDDQAFPIIKALLAHNADPNKRDVSGGSPLHWASGKNCFRCMDLLLRYGANINAQNDNGATPLHQAMAVGYHPTKTRLAPLDTRSIQLLLNAGADPTILNGSGYSPLHKAACLGRPEFFEELIRFVPIQDIVKEKRKAAVFLLLCFKRFKWGKSSKRKIPKDIQLVLCEYCTPGIVDIDALVDGLVENKIETLREWFALKVDDLAIRDIAESQKITNIAYNIRYDKVQKITDLDKLDQHKLVIRKSIKKLLQDTPLWGNVWGKQGVKR